MKHTQGNWKVKKYPAVGYPFFITSEYTSTHIALIGLPTESDKNEEEAEANANLIAAAPELLEALQELKSKYLFNQTKGQAKNNHLDETLLKVDQVINKALNNL